MAYAQLDSAETQDAQKPRWPYPSAGRVCRAEQLVLLDAKLVKIPSDQTVPADAAERVAPATLCQQP